MENPKSKVLHIGDTEFQKEVLESPIPVLVDFWAPWCRPCLMVAPVLDELSLELNGKLKIVKVNVDENQETAYKLNIQAIPTMAVFDDGNPVNIIVGVRPKSELQRILQEALSGKD
ncbi:thioredoxin [bacterium]|nr:thioredoxin [candidate division CSSED10-310 bacterium]